jgi:hypothetical protein
MSTEDNPKVEVPPESVLSGIDLRSVSFREMARFEAAIDTLNQHVGLVVERLREEKDKPAPDDSEVARLSGLHRGFVERRRTLRSHDTASVDAVLSQAKSVQSGLGR